MRLRDFVEIDFALLIAAVTLTTFGILFIYSSGVSAGGVVFSEEYIKQIIWGITGLIFALTIAVLNYRRAYHISIYLYMATIVLLLYTCVLGRTVHNSRSWIGLGTLGIQPSEFAKITTILLLAQFLDSTKRSMNALPRFFVSCLIAFFPMILVLIQPDFGTSLVFIPILISMTFIAGISLRYIFFLIITIAISCILLLFPIGETYILKKSIPILILITDKRFVIIVSSVLLIIFFIALYGFMRYKKKYFYWIDYSAVIGILSLLMSYSARKVLKEYQLKRLIVFLAPDVDPLGAGWNINQSVTAIGSGGFVGKGYIQGTQSHYRFLPQQSTDFIFSIFSEEWGFIGGMLVFALFLLICLRFIKIMNTTADTFGVYITAGLSGMFIFHFVINVGMTMGIMPITGIPLLFMSYGGSSLLSAMIGVGLALSVHIRRFQY
ncbi:MAG: rod shape-determining protein RodA [Termitinemataceae bacterium]|nr:MAG: rod shape-determining protein RodA [Termitinemataceae bacterium]